MGPGSVPIRSVSVWRSTGTQLGQTILESYGLERAGPERCVLESRVNSPTLLLVYAEVTEGGQERTTEGITLRGARHLRGRDTGGGPSLPWERRRAGGVGTEKELLGGGRPSET